MSTILALRRRQKVMEEGSVDMPNQRDGNANRRSIRPSRAGEYLGRLDGNSVGRVLCWAEEKEGK